MKPKISYANISKKVLKMVIGESYGMGDYTLKDELDKYGEDIILAQYKLHANEHNGQESFDWFLAWSKTYAMVLIDTGFGDRCILGLQREIPQLIGIGEFNGRSKEKRKRTSSRNSKTNKR